MLYLVKFSVYTLEVCHIWVIQIPSHPIQQKSTISGHLYIVFPPLLCSLRDTAASHIHIHEKANHFIWHISWTPAAFEYNYRKCMEKLKRASIIVLISEISSVSELEQWPNSYVRVPPPTA